MLALPIQTHTNHWPFHQINFVPSSQPQLGDPAGMHLWTGAHSTNHGFPLSSCYPCYRVTPEKMAWTNMICSRRTTPPAKNLSSIYPAIWNYLPFFRDATFLRPVQRLAGGTGCDQALGICTLAAGEMRGISGCWIEILTHGTVDGRNPIKPS